MGFVVTTKADEAEGVFLSAEERSWALGGVQEWFFNGGSETRRLSRADRRAIIEGGGGRVLVETAFSIKAQVPPDPLLLLACIKRHADAKEPTP